MSRRTAIKGISRFLAILLTFMTGFLPVLSAKPGAAAAARSDTGVPVRLLIDGALLQTQDQAILTQGRTLVPLRVLMETLGAQVYWEPEARTVTVPITEAPM